MSEGFLNLRFHGDEPGYGPEHFDRLMPLDKVAVAMYGCLYDDLANEEQEDLVIAHCLGEPAKRDPPHVRKPWYPRGLPRSQRRI
jgi:hypothetical protein